MGTFTCCMFHNHTVTITHQHSNCIRGKGNPVFLESVSLGMPINNGNALGFDIQCFFQCFVTERSTDYWFTT